MSLKEKIESKKAKVAVIGLGYVGLPLAIEIAKSGFEVVGIDVGKGRLELAAAESGGKIKTTSDHQAVEEADIILVCVPTPLSKHHDPDLSHVVDAANKISEHIGKGKLVVLESTTYPGTTEEVVLPILEKKGSRVGKDFFLAFSPERVDPGNKKYPIKSIPKIVGGVTTTCHELATSFYQKFIDKVVPVSSTRVAEMAKLLENIFRAVNVALVNELTLLCDRMKIDVWEVIEAASTKSFGFMPFRPGPGLGGHCCPIDPFYLSWKAREYEFHTEFIELSGKINEQMPYYVVQKINDALNGQGKSLHGSKILILGVAYKKDIDDIRQSPAVRIIELLTERNANISYHDPYIKSICVQGQNYRSLPLSPKLLKNSDCVAIITDHSNVDYRKAAKHSRLIVDARNALHDFKNKKIIKI